MQRFRCLYTVLVLALVCVSIAGCFVQPGVGAPVFTVSSSGITSTVTITSAVSGADLFYTLDGTAATAGASAYSAPLTVAGIGVSKTVNAIAVKAGFSSETGSQTVAIAPPTLAVTGSLATFAGMGASGATNGAAAVATFSHPTDLATDGTSLYVADSGNNLIRRVDIATGTVTTLAGSGAAAEADGTGAMASFNGPAGITTDGTSLYVTDTIGCTVRRVVIATGCVTTIAGTGAYGCIDGTGCGARFASPAGIATDGEHLYVADYGANTIRRVTISTGCVTTLAGSGLNAGVDGIGTKAAFSHPRGVATDGTNLYVADYAGCTIRKVVLSTGAVTTIAGSGSATEADGIGAAAGFGGPAGILTDGSRLFVSDLDGDALRRVTIATGSVTTLFSDADYLQYPGNDHFKALSGMTTDGAAIYLTEMEANIIRRVN